MLLAAAPLHAAPSTPLLTSLDVPASTVEERDNWVGKLQDMLTKERKRQAEEEKRNTSWFGTLACRRALHLAFDMMTKLSQKQ